MAFAAPGSRKSRSDTGSDSPFQGYRKDRQPPLLGFCLLFYTLIRILFNNLQGNVRIRDFFMLIMHWSPEEGSDGPSLQKDTLTPSRHTMPTEWRGTCCHPWSNCPASSLWSQWFFVFHRWAQGTFCRQKPGKNRNTKKSQLLKFN